MNYQTGQTTPSRELQIPLALDELQTIIERIGKTSEDLSLRLGKVLIPDSPTINSMEEKSMPLPPRAEYVDNLRNKAAQLRRICEMLDNILSRLEL